MNDAHQTADALTSAVAPAIALRDRADAGRQLASKLAHHCAHNALVLAISNGGVPVGREIARGLNAEFDVIIARKLRHRSQPSLTLGAVIADGTPALNHASIEQLGLSSPSLDQLISEETAAAHSESLHLRRGLPPHSVRLRTVILVDDGVVTGATLRAAIRWLRPRLAGTIIAAVPVCSRRTADDLAYEVDEFVCLQRVSPQLTLAECYREFERVSDETVEQLLRDATNARTSGRDLRAGAA